jgi:hypothetical protein
MAKANNNLILSHLSGTIGNQLTVRQVGGNTIVSKKQKKSKNRPSEKQAAVKVNFKESTHRAKWLLKDPDMFAFYTSVKGPGQTAYNMAVKDVINPPQIVDISAESEKITVRAIDVFRVYRVTVIICSPDGVLLEQGDALLARNGKDWSYATKNDYTALKGATIQAEAEDVPGNKTSAAITL